MHAIEGDFHLSYFWKGVNITSEGLLYMAGEKGILQQLRDILKGTVSISDKKSLNYLIKEVAK
jgi:hypothetical protein